MATSRTERESRKSRYTDAKKVAEERAVGSRPYKIPDGMGFFRPEKPAVYWLDIAAYEVGKGNPHADEGMLHYERTFWVHRDIGPGGDAYICPAKNSNKPCPICEHRLTLMRDPDPKIQKLVKDLAPKERQLFLVKDVDDKKGWTLWDISFHLFGKYLDNKVKFSSERDGYERFYYLDEGMTLRVTASEKTMPGSKPFLEFTDIEFRKREKQYDEKLLDNLPCLDDLIVEMPYDTLKKIYLQVGDEKEQEGEGDRNGDDKPSNREERTRERDRDHDEDAPRKSRRDEDDDRPKSRDKDDDDRPQKKEKTAEDLDIAVGAIVRHDEHGKCTVVHVSGDGTSLRLEDKEDNIHRAINPNDVELIKPAPKEKAKDEDDDDRPRSRKAKEDDEDAPIEDDDDTPPSRRRR